MAVSYARGDSDIPLLDETIGANLDRTIAHFGDDEALVDVPTGRRWTYRQLGIWIDDVARGLLAVGVAKGDRVGIWAPNCPEWLMVQYATARIGAILVTVNPAYRRDELQYVLNRAGVSVLFSAARHKTSDYRGLVEAVRADCPTLRRVVYLEHDPWRIFVDRGVVVPATGLHDRAATLSCDDPIGIQYTSGTTGPPKGATLSHRGMLNNGYFVGKLLGYTERDRVCLPVPFHHYFGMVTGNLGATSHGACVVIPAPTFDPAATLRAVDQERVTSLLGMPSMFVAELDLPDLAEHDLRSLRTGVMAGAPCPAEVVRRVRTEMRMAEVAVCYGMTETSSVSTQSRRDDDEERRATTVGRVVPHVEIKVVDPATHETVPRGVSGELCTRGYSVMLKYWNEPQRTAEAIDSNGWMHSGDLAVMREDGYVRIVGRITWDPGRHGSSERAGTKV